MRKHQETETTAIMSAAMADGETCILKLHAPSVDVEKISGIMQRAREVVQVPKVYRYGYSGNCAFIMMEFIGGYNLDYWSSQLGESVSADPHVIQQIQNIVCKLASIGISHNDLYPRNIVVNKKWEILAVVDWDVAGSLDVSQEYIRRKHCNLEPYCHDWDFLFLASSPDKFITALDWMNHLPVSRRHVIMQRGLVSVERDFL